MVDENESFKIKQFWEEAEGLVVIAETENEYGIKVKGKYKIAKYNKGSKLVELIPFPEGSKEAVIKNIGEVQVVSIVK